MNAAWIGTYTRSSSRSQPAASSSSASLTNAELPSSSSTRQRSVLSVKPRPETGWARRTPEPVARAT